MSHLFLRWLLGDTNHCYGAVRSGDIGLVAKGKTCQEKEAAACPDTQKPAFQPKEMKIPINQTGF